MLKYIIWDDEKGKYIPVPIEEVENILPPFAIEMLEIAFSDESSIGSIARSLDERPDYVEPRPADCVCSDDSFESYGCTCRRRINPG